MIGIAAWFASLAVAAGGEPVGAAAPPANVVFILSDDQHWRDYAFMGHPHLRTPHLDRLARESLVFTRGYVTSSLCSPSLASVITGRYPHEHRVVGNDPPGGKEAFAAGRERMARHLEEWPTLPRLLGARGYASLQTGKWWQGDFSRGGFTEGMTKGARHGDEGLVIGRKTMQPIYDFIGRSRAAGKPFFVWYAPMLPHDPHDPAPELVEHYAAKTDSIHVARYWGNVERFDRTVGDLLDHLDRENLSANTLVVYVTDNGWIQSLDNPRCAPRSKLSPYDGGVRSPIMLRRPGTIQPGTNDALASAIDIMPTVLAACGVEPPAGLPGVNLLDAQAVAARRQVFGECYKHTLVDLDDPAQSLLWRWTVRDRWKLIVPATAGADRKVELFDVVADPGETRNVTAEHPDVVADLRASLDAWWNPKKEAAASPAVGTDLDRGKGAASQGKMAAGLPSPPASLAELPRFSVPGFEDDMRSLNDLHALHHDAAFSTCTLWDGWLPMSTIWASSEKQSKYRAALLERRIDADGYVSMQQHRGLAHSDGWPFPAWQQSGGAGFHFSTAREQWAIKQFRLKPLASTEGWEISGAEVQGIDPVQGLKLKASADVVTIATPSFRCGVIVAPFARLEWAVKNAPADVKGSLEWQLEGETQWPAGREVPMPVPSTMRYTNVPLHQHAEYSGVLVRYRIRLERAAGAEIDLTSIITAIDTRHPVTNALYLRGCCDYFAWTQDLEFLRRNIGRMRKAVNFALEEFSVREQKHVFVCWVGHDGRSGIAIGPGGRKTKRFGHGVGNNYWDLLPFGGHDALATIYLYDALRAVATLETAITNHPEWRVPSNAPEPDAIVLDALADDIRRDFGKRFWNESTGRFVGWIDVDGRAYDYGFTFVNLEAIASGLASTDQSTSIFAWLDGRRSVPGDTSVGTDIYHWRFAPRATTRRNVKTYMWAWFNPEKIPWGGQVQDGGAVLGFSYHDIMARLKVNGPDDAWKRLREIAQWFREVEAEGGYRRYYAEPGRGTLQGGGTAGGLGLDREFMESVLVPQVILQGFLGFQASPEGFHVEPHLPPDWPSLTVTGIRFQDRILDVTAYPDGRVDVNDRGRLSATP